MYVQNQTEAGYVVGRNGIVNKYIKKNMNRNREIASQKNTIYIL